VNSFSVGLVSNVMNGNFFNCGGFTIKHFASIYVSNGCEQIILPTKGKKGSQKIRRMRKKVKRVRRWGDVRRLGDKKAEAKKAKVLGEWEKRREKRGKIEKVGAKRTTRNK